MDMELLKIIGVVLFFLAFGAWGMWVSVRAEERKESEKKSDQHQPPVPGT